MDASLMLRTAVLLWVLTALGGLLMAGLRLAGRPHPPDWLAMAHGLLAGSGLTLVLYVAFTQGLAERGWWGLAAIALAAVGGLVLNLGYHTKRRALPVWLMLVHAAVAVLGLVLLGWVAWR